MCKFCFVVCYFIHSWMKSKAKHSMQYFFSCACKMTVSLNISFMLTVCWQILHFHICSEKWKIAVLSKTILIYSSINSTLYSHLAIYLYFFSLDKLCLDRNPFCPLLKDKCNTVSEVRMACPGTCSLCQGQWCCWRSNVYRYIHTCLCFTLTLLLWIQLYNIFFKGDA